MRQVKIITALIISVTTYFSACGQDENENIVKIFASVDTKINKTFSVIDSLVVISNDEIDRFQKYFKLSATEKKELKGARGKGSQIKVSFFLKNKLFSADTFFSRLRSTDAADIKYISENSPMYLISRPLIFSKGNKAIVNIDLFKRQGITYLLKKEKGIWIVDKEYLRWVS